MMSASLLRRRWSLLSNIQTRDYSGRAKALFEDAATRRENFLQSGQEMYPRLKLDQKSHGRVLRHVEFLEKYDSALQKGEKRREEVVTIRGRLRSYRDVSSRLVFYDVIQDDRKIQGVSNFSLIGGSNKEFYEQTTALRVGDIVSVTGHPGRTISGELSVYANSHPELLAPCLHQIPDILIDPGKLRQHRHLDLLVHRTAAQTLKLRSRIIQRIRTHFTDRDFVEVQTPILSYTAGGAIAKPFITEASAIHRPLALRIAPELWLKRLLVGGLDRVFELGPSFRNEGIDATHNPEFTTCEFYQAFGRLQDIIEFTENLFHDIAHLANELKMPDAICGNLPELDPELDAAIARPFPRLEFCPALEKAMGEPLPALDGRPDADIIADLTALCSRVKLPAIAALPSPTPALILDKLAGHFIEPQCQLPTFITYHPECMAPLAKSHERHGRRVSDRFELFVNGQELVNAYEEENSPFEQRKKMLKQQGEADETYCKTLEWGMPPTAGWGMGVDRLIMLFSGHERIADVVAFGGLRGAANQGGCKGTKTANEVEELAMMVDRSAWQAAKSDKIKRRRNWLANIEKAELESLNDMFGNLAESLTKTETETEIKIEERAID